MDIEMGNAAVTKTAHEELAFSLDEALTTFYINSKIMTALLDNADEALREQSTFYPTSTTDAIKGAIAMLAWQFDHIRDVEATLGDLRDDAFEKMRSTRQRERAPLLQDVKRTVAGSRRGIDCWFNDAGEWNIRWLAADGTETIETYQMVVRQREAEAA